MQHICGLQKETKPKNLLKVTLVVWNGEKDFLLANKQVV